MKPIIALCLLVAATSSVRAADEAHDTHDAHQADIIAVMGQMQLFLHKISLSVNAGNLELADFYAHELEETIEAAESIEAYHDIAVGDLTASMLTPTFEAFEDALDGGKVSDVEARLETLIDSCNACHQATGYGVIHIAPNDTNPYLQSFQPRD